MSTLSFEDYLRSKYTSRSGVISSYLNAIQIIDELFHDNDVLGLNGQPISEIRNPLFTNRIIDFIIDEENKYKHNTPSFFDAVRPGQKSYPRGGFCRAAIKQLGEYVNKKCLSEVIQLTRSCNNGAELSSKLSERFQINDHGTEIEVRAKHRLGQDIFRKILMEIYQSKCCVSCLEIPEVLRASHIVSWAERVDSRLNPANGLCLSATYDAAFDRHLITFDEDYRLVLSKTLKDNYSSSAFENLFLKFEGQKMTLPSIYIPSQEFLKEHREKLVV